MAEGPSGFLETGVSPAAPRSSSEEEFARAPPAAITLPAYIECGIQTASQRRCGDDREFCASQRELRGVGNAKIEHSKPRPARTLCDDRLAANQATY
jgi:hypothetical protein